MASQSIIAACPAPARERADTDDMWTCYAQGRDPEARARLVAAYLGFARIMAAKVYARRSYTSMEFADYLQYARVGLLEAIDRFEPARGYRFETYAASRINGAILNGIEQSSEIQQQIAARKCILSQRIASLDEGEAAPSTPGMVFARLAELAIGLAVGFALEDTGMHGGGDYPDNSYHGAEMKQLRARVRAAVATLPDKQRQVIHAHYLQHQAFADVAAAMFLSRGRVAQIHKEALGNLQARLQDLKAFDLSC